MEQGERPGSFRYTGELTSVTYSGRAGRLLRPARPRFATVDRGYSEAEVDEFVAKVGISLAVAEAARAHAPARTRAAGEGAAEARGDLVPVAIRLRELA